MRLFFLLALLAAPSLAAAHGARPVALNVFFPDGEDSLTVESNFGLIRRHSDGSWRLLCEEAISPGVKWFNVDETGRIAIGHAGGLATSTDGCHFAASPGTSSGVRWIERVATGTGVPPGYFVLLDVYEPGKNLFASLDGGTTLRRVTTPEGLLVNSVRADRSSPGRVLVIAQAAEKTYRLLVSDDFGVTWAERALPELPGIVRVLAVSPSGVFLRTSHVSLHAIWRAETADAAFERVLGLTEQPPFLADVGAGVLWTAGGAKAFRSVDGGRTWGEQAVPGELLCLVREGRTLYACSANRETNAAVSRSEDEGATWQIALKFSEIAAMAECDEESDVGAACQPLWPLIHPALLNERPATPLPEPPARTGCGMEAGSLLAVAGLLVRRQRSTGRGR
jgi:hypothetical protein